MAAALAALVVGAVLLLPRVVELAGVVQAPPDLSQVRTWEISERRHTHGDVGYVQDPPAGGPHAPAWLACGAYDVPVREENAVHDLEHGTVWITHDPDLDESEVDRLEELLPDNAIMSPREGLPSPVVVTVWGAQLALEDADDPRLPMFLAEYGDGHTAPEAGASCHGGTPDPSGEAPGSSTAV